MTHSHATFVICCAQLTLLLVSAGCTNRGGRAARERRAIEVQQALCGARVGDSCKVASLDGDNGPLLAIKYSRATDDFTASVAKNTVLSQDLLKDGFVEIAVSDGLYYWRRWRLVHQQPASAQPVGMPVDASDAAFIKKIEVHVRETDEVQVQAVVDQSTSTLRLYSDEMSGAASGNIVNDAELHNLMRYRGLKRLVISDRNITWRDYNIPEGPQR